MTPEFRVYQHQVVANCRVLAETLMELGYKVVTGTIKNLGNTHQHQDATLLLTVALSLTSRFIQSGRGCRVVAPALQLQLQLRYNQDHLQRAGVAVMVSPFPYLMTAASSVEPEMMVIIAALCHLAGEASSSQNSFLKGVPESHLKEVRYQWSHSWWVAEPRLETNLVSGQDLRAFSTAMLCTVLQECLHSP